MRSDRGFREGTGRIKGDGGDVERGGGGEDDFKRGF